MSTGESLYFLSFRKKGAEYVLSTKEERQKKYRQSEMASYYRRRWVMLLEGREPHMAISKKENCPIHRDWHDEENDFKEKSVRYTEIRHTISHMKSQMRESRTSGSVRGVPCERYVYSTPVLNCKRKMNKIWLKSRMLSNDFSCRACRNTIYYECTKDKSYARYIKEGSCLKAVPLTKN